MEKELSLDNVQDEDEELADLEEQEIHSDEGQAIQKDEKSQVHFGKSLFSARQTHISDPASRPSFYERQFTDIKGQPLDMNELRG
ncbi:unnamed protein product, partial [Rotaria sp. Silwood2]